MNHKYGQAHQRKNLINKAAIKFNLKPKNGLKFLEQAGIIASEPHEQKIQDMVNFFKTTPQLDATMLGDYIGDIEEL